VKCGKKFKKLEFSEKIPFFSSRFFCEKEKNNFSQFTGVIFSVSKYGFFPSFSQELNRDTVKNYSRISRISLVTSSSKTGLSSIFFSTFLMAERMLVWS